MGLRDPPGMWATNDDGLSWVPPASASSHSCCPEGRWTRAAVAVPPGTWTTGGAGTDAGLVMSVDGLTAGSSVGVGDRAFMSSAAAVPSPGAPLDTAIVAALATINLCRTSSLQEKQRRMSWHADASASC
jgi:hypothetical protein